MKEILPRYVTDYSAKDSFCFGICCEECKKIWYSRKTRFSKAGVLPDTEGKKVIYDVLYEREWKQARESACVQGREVFNVCPVCGRLICDSCFMICEDLDMCCRCAKALETEGEVVRAAEENG